MSHPRHHLLIVGTGSIGERHLRCFLTTGRCDVSFIEPRAEVAEAISRRYPTARRFATLSEGIASGATGAVIATPATMHLAQGTECVRHGVSVLIEKPLSVTFDGLDEFQSACAASTAKVAVAYVYRANPVLASMSEAIAAGTFGRPLQFTAVTGQNFPTYRPAYAETYYASRSSGGGAVQDALTHVINVGEWLLGPITRLVSDLDHRQLSTTAVEDMAHVIARHGNIPASYSLNQYQPANELTFTVVCERAVVRFEGHLARWRVMWQPDTPWEDHPFPPLDRDTAFIRQAVAFLDFLEGQAPPLCSLEEGISTLKANHAILQSAEQQRWQEI